MKLDRLRIILALVLAGGYVLLVGVVASAIIAKALTTEDGIEIIEELSKVLPGFIGMIVGYYFSRSGGQGTGEGEPPTPPEPAA